MRISDVIILCEKKVQSSWLSSVTRRGKNALIVTNGGQQYTVHGVPQDIIKLWIASQSKGQFFHQNIKGKYVIT